MRHDEVAIFNSMAYPAWLLHNPRLRKMAIYRIQAETLLDTFGSGAHWYPMLPFSGEDALG